MAQSKIRRGLKFIPIYFLRTTTNTISKQSVAQVKDLYTLTYA